MHGGRDGSASVSLRSAPTPRGILHRSIRHEWGERYPLVTSDSRNGNIKSDRPT